jgi:hypothetical protein
MEVRSKSIEREQLIRKYSLETARTFSQVDEVIITSGRKSLTDSQTIST